jgi:hypothetical protein
MKKPKRTSINRRNFVKVLPAAGAAAIVASKAPLKSLAQTPSPTPGPSPSPAPMRITKEMMHNAEKLIGIEFTDAQEAMALRNVNGNLDSY